MLTKRSTPVKVFLSYSRKDKALKERLDVHLTALKRSGRIDTWDDRQITAGIEWDDRIRHELEEADIILLLISSDFLASDYIWTVEIAKAIQRHQNKEAVVIAKAAHSLFSQLMKSTSYENSKNVSTTFPFKPMLFRLYSGQNRKTTLYK